MVLPFQVSLTKITSYPYERNSCYQLHCKYCILGNQIHLIIQFQENDIIYIYNGRENLLVKKLNVLFNIDRTTLICIIVRIYFLQRERTHKDRKSCCLNSFKISIFFSVGLGYNVQRKVPQGSCTAVIGTHKQVSLLKLLYLP